MRHPLVTVVLLAGLLFSGLALGPQLAAVRLPANQQGYEPAQPIAFSHRLHAGEMQIPCLYCHSAAERSRHAGVPAASTCMNCHQFVTAPLGALRAEDEQAKREGRRPQAVVSPELRKLYAALALDARLQPDAGQEPNPIAWIKVHSLPDYVYFDHRAHVGAGVACQQCHGAVETMERVRQDASLTMGSCVNCHREANRLGIGGRPVRASTDCATCHY
jgi:hypothetical protein